MNACCWYFFLTKESGNKICFFLSFNKDHRSFITYNEDNETDMQIKNSGEGKGGEEETFSSTSASQLLHQPPGRIRTQISPPGLGWGGEKSVWVSCSSVYGIYFWGTPVCKYQTPLKNAFFLLLTFGNQMVSCLLLPLSLQTERAATGRREGGMCSL